MDSNISQTISFLKSFPNKKFPHSRFNYNRNKMGRSSGSLQWRMTHISSHRDPYVYFPFDADDLSRCLWWIIDNPVYWKKENFLSIANANPEWKGIIVWLIPLIQELMMTPTREEPDLSKWIRQIMNDSIDPPPHHNMEEAAELVAALKRQYTGSPTSLKISSDGSRVWKNFQSDPQKLTNDLVTIASKHKGRFRIVAKNKKELQILFEQNNRWTTKITYAPVVVTIMYYGETG